MRLAFVTLALAASLAIASTGVSAKGGGGHSSESIGHSGAGHSSSKGLGTRSTPGPGSGSKTESEGVHGYHKKDGTYVAPYRRSTPDKSTTNNWSAKGNTNPDTGKPGTRIAPPKKP